MTKTPFADGQHPLYNVGDRVLIANPIDIFDIEDTTVYTVTHVRYSDKHLAFAYRLNNGHMWVNEAWLEPDFFGPQFIDDDAEANEAARLKALELDYELRSLSHAISTQDKAEHARAMARLRELTVTGDD